MVEFAILGGLDRGVVERVGPVERSDAAGDGVGASSLAGMGEQAMNYQLATRGVEVPEGLDYAWRLLLLGLLTRDRDHRWGAMRRNAGLRVSATSRGEEASQRHRRTA